MRESDASDARRTLRGPAPFRPVDTARATAPVARDGAHGCSGVAAAVVVPVARRRRSLWWGRPVGAWEEARTISGVRVVEQRRRVRGVAANFFFSIGGWRSNDDVEVGLCVNALRFPAGVSEKTLRPGWLTRRLSREAVSREAAERTTYLP